MFAFAARSRQKTTGTFLLRQPTAVSRTVTAERVIFTSLLLLIGLSAVPFGSIEPWWEGVFESLICMIGACSVLTSMNDRSWRLNSLVAPFIGLLLFAYFQSLTLGKPFGSVDLWLGPSESVSVDPFQTKLFVIKLLSLTLTLAMLLRYVSNRKTLAALAHVVIIIGAASAAFAIWRRVLPTAWLESLANGKLQGESFGQFMNRNHFALLMEMSFGVALGLTFYGQRNKRYLYGAVALWTCMALILANSRGGIISMLGQIGFVAWIALSRLFGTFPAPDARDKRGEEQPWWRPARLLALRCMLIIVLLGAALSSVLMLGGEPVRGRLESVPAEFLSRRGDTENTAPRRLEIWNSTWELIKAHPWLGSGFGAYKTAITQYFHPTNDWQPKQAHNEYLEVLSGGGLVGAALGIWLVVILIRDSRYNLQAHDAFRRAVCLGAVVGLVGVSIHSLVDFGLHTMVNALVCCGLVALATAKFQSSQLEASPT